MSQDQDLLIKGHEYDGIKEFDNPLPGWWLVTIYATIIFAFIYVIHYEFGSGPTLAQEPKVLAMGAEVFTGKCASCHGNELQGLIGPNLTDKYWIHGKGKISDIV